MDKKGDFGAKTLVSIILTILGFVILIVFLVNVINPAKLDKEACHKSVIVRGTMPSALESYVPLNCKTEKICVTAKSFGGKCDDFENSKGITYVKVKSNEQVEKLISESIVDCWSMIGEGKVSLFNQFLVKEYGIGEIYPSCVMCSRIAFDKESLKNSNINLSNIDVEKYMATHAIGSGDISYIDYISGENSAKLNINRNINFPNISGTQAQPLSVNLTQTLEVMNEEEKKAFIESQRNNFSLQTDEIGILFMQVSAPKGGETLANIAKTSLGIGGLAVGTFGFKNTFGAVTRIGRLGVKACGTPVSGTVCAVAALGAVFLQQANVAANRNIAAGLCSDVSVGDKARDGCSAVRVVNYDEESIAAYCVGIESSK